MLTSRTAIWVVVLLCACACQSTAPAAGHAPPQSVGPQDVTVGQAQMVSAMKGLSSRLDALGKKLDVVVKMLGEAEGRAAVADLQRRRAEVALEVVALEQRFTAKAPQLVQKKRELAEIDAMIARMPGLPPSR